MRCTSFSLFKPMFDYLLKSGQFNLWLGLASLGIGLAVVTPCLLVAAWRRKILRADLDIEGVGLILLAIIIVAIGCYNYLSSLAA